MNWAALASSSILYNLALPSLVFGSGGGEPGAASGSSPFPSSSSLSPLSEVFDSERDLPRRSFDLSLRDFFLCLDVERDFFRGLDVDRDFFLGLDVDFFLCLDV